MPEDGIYGDVGKQEKNTCFCPSLAAYLLLYVIAFGDGSSGDEMQ